MATPLINTAVPNPAPVAVPGVAQASNAVSPQGTMQGSQTSTTPPAPVTPLTPAPQDNVAQIITQARQQGIPDDQIFNALHQNGMIPTNAVVTQGQSSSQGAQLSDTGSFGSNLANSAGSFLGGIGQAVAHPIDTAKNLGNTLLGAAESTFTLGQKSTPQFDALANSLTQRYGSWDAVKKTMYQDPVGFLADLSSVASGVGEAISATGDVSKLGTLSKIGGAVNKVAEATNPLNIVTKPLGWTSSLAKAGLENVGAWIEKNNLRMTPADKTKYAQYIQPVSEYIAKELPAVGPEGKHAAVIEAIGNSEDDLQNWLKSSGMGDRAVDTSKIASSVDAIKTAFKNDRDSLAINNQIDDFKKLLETNYPDGQISVSDLNALKRSTFKSAYNSTGLKVSDAVEWQIGDTLYDHLKTTLGDQKIMGQYTLEDFNKQYQLNIKAERLLKASIGRPQIGFPTRLLLDAIGFHSTGPIGALATHAAVNYLPVTAAKSVIGKTAGVISKGIPKVKLPAGVATAVTAGSRANTMSKVKAP